MNAKIFYRKKSIIFQNLKSNFSCYKKTFFIFLAIFLVAFFTGLFTVFRYSGTVDSDLITDRVLKLVVKSDAVFWNVLLLRIFWVGLVCFVAYLTSLSVYLFVVNVSMFVYWWYCIGVNVGIVVKVLNVKGIIFIVFVHIPLVLIMGVLTLLLNAIFVKNCLYKRKFGCFCHNSKESVVLCVILLFISFLIQAILYPFFNNIFILT